MTCASSPQRPRGSSPQYLRTRPGFGLACVAAFIVIDALLLANPVFPESHWYALTLAIPQAQCSAIAFWAVLNPGNRLLRFSISIAVVLLSWQLALYVIPIPRNDIAVAGWTIMLAVQTILVAALTKALLSLLPKTNIGNTGRPTFQFDSGTVLLWTLVFATCFGVMQFGRAQYGWTREMIRWEFCHRFFVSGVCNALAATICFWGFIVRHIQQILIRLIPAVIAIAGITYGAVFITRAYSGHEALNWLATLMWQCVTITLTLWLLGIKTSVADTALVSTIAEDVATDQHSLCPVSSWTGGERETRTSKSAGLPVETISRPPRISQSPGSHALHRR